MAENTQSVTKNGTEEADLAKAFQELAKGEKTAAALENQLSAMEAKIEELLAQAEKDQNAVEKLKSQNGKSSNGTIQESDNEQSSG